MAYLPGDHGTRVYRDSSTGEVREITPDELDVLRLRVNPSHTYNDGYEPTGVQVVDDLLAAIAWASDWLHDSTRWGEEIDISSYGPLRKGENFADLIQSIANDGADEIRKALLR